MKFPITDDFNIYKGTVDAIEATPPDVGWYAPAGVKVAQSNPPTDEPGKWIEEGGVWREVALEDVQAIFMAKIQDRLDSFARSDNKAYDNMLSACTYATSTNPVFGAEGQYCVQQRDDTWAAANDFLNTVLPKVMEGKRPIPTWEEVEAVLPVLSWADVEYPEDA